MERPDPTELTAAAPADTLANAPALLISLHDVSPLTLQECRQAVALLEEEGVGADRLTMLLIPNHEGASPLDRDDATVGFARDLAARGTTLVMHGLTHRMPGRAFSPRGFFKGHVFARGQGELLRATPAETERALEQGAAILRRAGLAEACRRFVPPAWVLSRAARSVIEGAGLEFYETFAGLHQGAGAAHARRVIGWGSLGTIEATATAIWARLQTRRPVVDTRLAIHPADMRRPRQRDNIRRALRRLLPRMRAQNYATYWAGIRARAAT